MYKSQLGDVCVETIYFTFKSLDLQVIDLIKKVNINRTDRAQC